MEDKNVETSPWPSFRFEIADQQDRSARIIEIIEVQDRTYEDAVQQIKERIKIKTLC